MPINHKDVVVIGAGISGLVCAYRLKSLGMDVAVIEASERIGGVMRSDSIEGYLIERGPNSTRGTRELIALIRELGIADEMIEGDQKAPAYIYFNGQLHPVPSSAAAFIRSGLLSTRGKLRLLMEPLIPARHSSEEESVASFARRRFGIEVAERVVAPFVSGIYAGDAEILSVQAAFPQLAGLETSSGSLFRGMLAMHRANTSTEGSAGELISGSPHRRLISFKQGMGFLPETIAVKVGEDLAIGCCDCRIQALSRSRFSVRFNCSGVVQVLNCDCVAIATPASAAAKLVSSVSNQLARLLEEIEYPPLAIVHLSYKESEIGRPLDGFGFLVAPTERMRMLGCIWNSSLFEGRAPKGIALLTVFIGGARDPEAARLSESDLIRIAHAQLEEVLGEIGEPQFAATTRYERSIPQYNLGHAARVKQIENELRANKGLRLIGNYLHGVSVGDCIKGAELTATEISKLLSGDR
jgi:oxygen-dependent protoporphyrinogen oxidase